MKGIFMEKPLVSVIVIAYNLQDLIGECLDSVWKQDYDNFEVIVVDDGSRDDTLAVIKEKCQSGRAIIVDKENGGVVSARKAGLSAANGDYVTFVDGDDWLNKDMLSNFVREIAPGSEPDIIMTRRFKQRKDGSIVTTCDEAEYLAGSNPDQYFLNIMQGRLDHMMTAKFYKREFLIRARFLEYPETSMGEDLMFNACLGCYQPKVVYGKSVNYYYRYNQGSLIRRGGAKLLNQIQSLENIEAVLRQTGYAEKYPGITQGQWLTYCEAYLISPHTSLRVKNKIIESCRSKLKGIERNPYFQDRSKGWFRRTNLKVYHYFPCWLVGPVSEMLFYLNRAVTGRNWAA